MTISALATPPRPATGGDGTPATSPDARSGGGTGGGTGDDLAHYARRLMARLDALGLRTSGPWETDASLMAVSAQCVHVEPYVGRTVWLLPPPGDPYRAAADAPASDPSGDGTGLYWHWQRPRRNAHGHPVARWFQPFCPAADPEKAATAISEAIFADVRRRDR